MHTQTASDISAVMQMKTDVILKRGGQSNRFGSSYCNSQNDLIEMGVGTFYSSQAHYLKYPCF